MPKKVHPKDMKRLVTVRVHPKSVEYLEELAANTRSKGNYITKSGLINQAIEDLIREDKRAKNNQYQRDVAGEIFTELHRQIS